MDHMSLVAIASLCMTQGGAGTRSARACLPWAMLFNAFGVSRPNVPQGGFAELVHVFVYCRGRMHVEFMTYAPGWPR